VAWPIVNTTDDELRQFAKGAGVHRLLEDGESYADNHRHAWERIKNWLKAEKGIDPDKVTNVDAFKVPALNYILFLAFRVAHKEDAQGFLQGYFAELRATFAEIAPAGDRGDGGEFAPIHIATGSGRNLRGQGSGLYYRKKRAGGFYGGR